MLSGRARLLVIQTWRGRNLPDVSSLWSMETSWQRSGHWKNQRAWYRCISSISLWLIIFWRFVMCQVETSESLVGIFPGDLINCGKTFSKTIRFTITGISKFPGARQTVGEIWKVFLRRTLACGTYYGIGMSCLNESCRRATNRSCRLGPWKGLSSVAESHAFAKHLLTKVYGM